MQGSPRHRWTVVTLALLAVVLAGALAIALATGPRSASKNSTAQSTNERLLVPKGRFSLDAMSKAEPSSGAVAGAIGGEAAAQPVSNDTNASLPSPSYNPTRFLVRTGEMSIVVAKGQVGASAARVTSLAEGYGGYVLSSQISTASGQSPTADIAVRVPARSYDQAIARFSELGTVQSVDTTTEDVTSQFVDLRARLAHYQAVNRRLLTFLAKAGSISEALAIQDRIDTTQLRVEQLTAQVKAMGEQTAYGTLSVSLAEKPAQPVVAHSNSFTAAMGRSWHRIVGGLEAIIVALGAIVPFAILALAVAFAVMTSTRWMGRRRSHVSVQQ